MKAKKTKKWPVPPTYRLVAGMSGQELLDGLAAPQKAYMAGVLRVELELRIVAGLKRMRR